MSKHMLERLSPKDEPFIGRCVYCYWYPLPPRAAQEECPSAPEDPDQPVLDALKPVEDGA